MSETQISIEVLEGIHKISAAEWDSCANPESDKARPSDPFTTHRFLLALEESGSVGRGTGWIPRHLIAREGEELIACAPLYAKSHSQGEYIFDHNIAHSYESAGGRYYPKFQMAVPFTPATGRRFLTKPGKTEIGISTLVQGAVQLASENNFSSVHVTFCTEEEAHSGEKIGLLHRTSQQFHWENPGYKDWDDFLNAMSSRKRKNIRKERNQANSFGGEIVELTGNEIEPAH